MDMSILLSIALLFISLFFHHFPLFISFFVFIIPLSLFHHFSLDFHQEDLLEGNRRKRLEQPRQPKPESKARSEKIQTVPYADIGQRDVGDENL